MFLVLLLLLLLLLPCLQRSLTELARARACVCVLHRLTQDAFMTTLSDITCIIGEASEKYGDVSQQEVLSLAQHISLFDSVVLRSGDSVLNKMMSSFSPELHLGEMVERLVRNSRAIVRAQDAAMFLVDRYACKLQWCLHWVV